MTVFRGHVVPHSKSGPNIIAYLVGFRIDQSRLNAQHKAWCDAEIVGPALRHEASTPDRVVSADTCWQISLCGTASRTGNWAHNLALSRRRVEATADYLLERLGESSVVFAIDRTWVGELQAIVKGTPDETEDPLDRAVLISVRKVRTPPPKQQPLPPAPVLRPSWAPTAAPCAYVRLNLDYLLIVKHAWSASMGGFRDDGSAQTTSPDRDRMRSALKAKGWTDKRALELAESGPYTRAPPGEAVGMSSVVGREIKRVREQLAHCTPDDPGNLMATGVFRQR